MDGNKKAGELVGGALIKKNSSVTLGLHKCGR